MKRLLAVPAVSLPCSWPRPPWRRFSSTTAPPRSCRRSGSTLAVVTEEDDVGYINQVLASDADDATKKAEVEKLIDDK